MYLHTENDNDALAKWQYEVDGAAGAALREI